MSESVVRKFAFMGSDTIALPALEALWKEKPDGLELAAVFTQPDRKHGRGMKLRENGIKQWAGQVGVPVFQPEKVRRVDADPLLESGIELVLVMAYGQILPRSFLDAFPRGVYNLHASLLPAFRGASPIHTALLSGESKTGVSFMRIVPKMDAGPVGDFEEVSITETTTAPQLIEAISLACVPLTSRALPAAYSGTLSFAEQDPERVRYCRLIRKEDANLDWRLAAKDLERKYRALQPWPGSRFLVDEDWIRVGEMKWAEDDSSNDKPGTIMGSVEEGLQVQCGTGSVILKTLQRPGGKMMPAEDFLRGYPLMAGKVLPLLEVEPFIR